MEADNDAHALVSVYGPADADLLEDSFHCLWTCEYKGSDNLRIIDISQILSVVSMQPLPFLPGERNDLWFVAEKSGLDDISLTGYVEPLDEIPVEDEGDGH